MQKIIRTDKENSCPAYINEKICEYIENERVRTFECFEKYYLLAFDWYDTRTPDKSTSQIIIYLDDKDLIFLCRDGRAYRTVKHCLQYGYDNARALYFFFVNLLSSDVDRLDELEAEITDTEDEALISSHRDYLSKIVEYRRELLRLKRYYEQLDLIIDNLAANDNGLIPKEYHRYFVILGNRADRFCRSVLNLRDYVTQMREAYQAQIDIEQNNIMKVLTIVTAIFLPLTLLVGWYGMNFVNMPELTWNYGYVTVMGISVAICVVLILYFKKKKWF